ncbi:MAG TPA: oligosaccharide flippase family protein [Candidatus Eisenbacteria bacterium]
MKAGEIAHSITRGAFYLALEKAAALLSGVAYFALLLRWLGPTKYGIMTLALSFTGLATMATGNFEVFLERYAAEYEAHGRLLTLRRAHLLALVLKLGLGLVAAALLVALAPLLAVQFKTPLLAMLVPMLALTVAFDGFSTTGRATLYGLQRFRWVSGIAVLFHIVKTVMVGALWGARQGLPQLAIGLTALAVAQGAASTFVPLWLLRRAEDPVGESPARPPVPARERPAPDDRTARGLMRSMAAYCVPLLGARVTFMSGQNLSKIVLGKLFDTALLGYFSFAFQTVERFVELLYTVPSSLLPSLTRLVARDERKRLGAVFDQALRLISVAACALSFGLFVFARELTLLVGSPLFEPAIPLVRILALVPVARTAQQPLTMVFQAMRLPGTVLRLAILKFAVEFGSYFALLPVLGIYGAAWANLAGALASYVGASLVMRRLIPEAPGRSSRTAVAARAVGLLAVLLLVALLCDWKLGHAMSLALRILLVPVGVLGVFALELVQRRDLEKLAAIRLRWGPARQMRDWVVAGAARIAHVAEPERIL